MRILCIVAAIALLGCQKHDDSAPTVFRTWHSENVYDENDIKVGGNLTISGSLESAVYTLVINSSPSETVSCSAIILGTTTSGSMVLNSCSPAGYVSGNLSGKTVRFAAQGSSLSLTIEGRSPETWNAL